MQGVQNGYESAAQSLTPVVENRAVIHRQENKSHRNILPIDRLSQGR